MLQHALMRTWDVWAARGDRTRPIDLGTSRGRAAWRRPSRGTRTRCTPRCRTTRTAACERAFRTLTEQGRDDRGIRRPTPVVDLAATIGADRATVGAVLDAFRAPGVTFLMPGVDVELGDRTVVDLSHESLMRGWGRLRGWADDEARSARIYRRLSDTARLWSDGRAGLFQQPDLEIAESWRERERPNAAWAQQYGGDFELAMRFLGESQDQAHALEREREAARQRELEHVRAPRRGAAPPDRGAAARGPAAPQDPRRSGGGGRRRGRHDGRRRQVLAGTPARPGRRPRAARSPRAATRCWQPGTRRRRRRRRSGPTSRSASRRPTWARPRRRSDRPGRRRTPRSRRRRRATGSSTPRTCPAGALHLEGRACHRPPARRAARRPPPVEGRGRGAEGGPPRLRVALRQARPRERVQRLPARRPGVQRGARAGRPGGHAGRRHARATLVAGDAAVHGAAAGLRVERGVVERGAVGGREPGRRGVGARGAGARRAHGEGARTGWTSARKTSGTWTCPRTAVGSPCSRRAASPGSTRVAARGSHRPRWTSI